MFSLHGLGWVYHLAARPSSILAISAFTTNGRASPELLAERTALGLVLKRRGLPRLGTGTSVLDIQIMLLTGLLVVGIVIPTRQEAAQFVPILARCTVYVGLAIEDKLVSTVAQRTARIRMGLVGLTTAQMSQGIECRAFFVVRLKQTQELPITAGKGCGCTSFQ